MKKLIAILAAAALLALTGCGITADVPAPTVETPPETTTLSPEEKIEKFMANNLKRYAMSVSELPEDAREVPADWIDFTDSGISVKLPAEPEKTVEDGETSFVLDVDGSDVELVFESAEAAEKRLEVLDMLRDSRMEVYQAAFEKLGIPFDGTKASFYMALLSITPDDVEKADDYTQTILSEMGSELFWINEAYIIERENAEVFVFHYSISIMDDDTEYYEACIFDSDGKQRDVSVYCDDKDAALRIAATADIAP
ncbi:MAG: hypothetical protein Q4A05_00130 [Ruminococcus sp.]|nr:hypothetical protein [Ruminococcus sp.]